MRVSDVTSVLLVGVGGQGTILAGDVLAKVAAASGLDVKLSEVHGMSQRGGSVDTMVRFGDRGALTGRRSAGEVDHLVAFEIIEAARWLPYLRPGGRLLVDRRTIAPLPVLTGALPPTVGLEALSSPRAPSSSMPTRSRARRARRARPTSCSSARCPWDCRSMSETWRDVIAHRVPPKTVEANLAAFELGREAASATS